MRSSKRRQQFSDPSGLAGSAGFGPWLPGSSLVTFHPSLVTPPQAAQSSSRQSGFKTMRGEFEHRVDLLAVHAREPLQEIIHRGTILQILEKSLHRHAGPAEDKSPAHRVRRGVHFRAVGPIEHGNTIVRAHVTCNLRPPRPLWSLIFSRGQLASARLPWRQLVCTRYQLIATATYLAKPRFEDSAVAGLSLNSWLYAAAPRAVCLALRGPSSIWIQEKETRQPRTKPRRGVPSEQS